LVTNGSPGSSEWRTGRWPLILAYLVTVIVPFLGQAIGLVIGVVLTVRPGRRIHGVIIVLLSIAFLAGWLALLLAASAVTTTSD
jgi:hypothetical protein